MIHMVKVITITQDNILMYWRLVDSNPAEIYCAYSPHPVMWTLETGLVLRNAQLGSDYLRSS